MFVLLYVFFVLFYVFLVLFYVMFVLFYVFFCVVLCIFSVVLCNVCVVLCIFCVVLCIFSVVLCNVCVVSFSVLFVCKCVLYYCHRVATQLQLNIYHIIYTIWVPTTTARDACIARCSLFAARSVTWNVRNAAGLREPPSMWPTTPRHQPGYVNHAPCSDSWIIHIHVHTNSSEHSNPMHEQCGSTCWHTWKQAHILLIFFRVLRVETRQKHPEGGGRGIFSLQSS
jgi:hypothetical protein